MGNLFKVSNIYTIKVVWYLKELGYSLEFVRDIYIKTDRENYMVFKSVTDIMQYSKTQDENLYEMLSGEFMISDAFRKMKEVQNVH